MTSRKSRFLAAAILPVVVTLTVAGCGANNTTAGNKAAANNTTGSAAATSNTSASSTGNATGNSTASAAPIPDNAVVATYSGGSVKGSELNQYLSIMALVNPQANTSTNSARTTILKQYIVIDKILANQASQAGFKPTSKTVQSDVSNFKSQVVQQEFSNSTQAYNQKLQSLKLTDAEVTKTLADEFAVEEYAASKISASDIQSYYNQNQASFTLTTQHGILVKDQATAQKVYKLLQADHSDANWTKLAKQYSQDPGSKNNGGVYSNQPASNWVPGYSKAVLTQPIGQVGKPFKTSYGWFVVEVTKRTVEPLSSVKKQVENQMLSDSSSKYSMNSLVTQAQGQANIKVTLPSS